MTARSRRRARSLYRCRKRTAEARVPAQPGDELRGLLASRCAGVAPSSDLGYCRCALTGGHALPHRCLHGDRWDPTLRDRILDAAARFAGAQPDDEPCPECQGSLMVRCGLPCDLCERTGTRAGYVRHRRTWDPDYVPARVRDLADGGRR